MNLFRYVRVENTLQAIGALERESGARVIAGGTNILDLMKIYVERPRVLVDINALPFDAIERRGDKLYIGALARLSDVAADADVRAKLPFVAVALEQSASPQLRNMATIGGNLLQRTRCPYFRDVAAACNKRAPGSGCSALEGENRREAVLGTSRDCIATHPSDLAVALAALDATVHIAGSAGNRAVSLREFYRLPKATPQIETTLRDDELIVAVSLPLLAFATRSAYVKVRDRAQYDFALASAAVALDLHGGTIREARVALGGVATVPWRSAAAERALSGAATSREVFARAADAALAGARGHGGNDFKVALAKRTLIRALEMAAQV
ncbi:MAG: xanthine dehydrogenase family protein subunit M [Candidatus Eremiobacteraeota bacterium]|nr:xanthine dehydrogenase family protein subunit M [Candidatus Eremiobacteraeota bacterium]